MVVEYIRDRRNTKSVRVDRALGKIDKTLYY